MPTHTALIAGSKAEAKAVNAKIKLSCGMLGKRACTSWLINAPGIKATTIPVDKPFKVSKVIFLIVFIIFSQ